MAFTNINVGTVANDGTGDSLRAAGLVINANFGLAALDAGVVHLTGAETVAGVKTFSSIPVGPASDPTTANQLTRKSYVDAGVAALGVTGLSSALPLMDGVATVGTSTLAARSGHIHPTDTSRAADSAVVHLAGSEIITGAKLFGNALLRITNPTSTFDLFFQNIDTTATASRGLSFNLNNVNRIVSLSGDLTVSGAATISGTNTGDQTLASLGAADDSAVVHLTGIETIAGVKTFAATGLRVSDAGGSGFAGLLRFNETMTASRSLFFILNDVNRTINLSGNLTVSAAATVSGTNTGDDAPQFIGGISADKTLGYTLVLGDAFTTLSFKLSASRNLTIPTNASVAFPIGTQILVAIDWVTGTDSLNIIGTGVVIRGITGVLVSSTATQKALLLTKVATNTWVSLGTL